MIRLSADRLRNEVIAQVEFLSGQNLYACYQCGKCSAGCPMGFAMDLKPSEVIRALQMGMTDAVFKANTIWMCASCLTCSSRCPKGIDVASVMDSLRAIRLRGGDRPVEASGMPLALLEETPQQAIISGFRKLSL